MPRSAEVVAHWDLLIDDFETSALDFYKSVEETAVVRQVPDLKVSRVDWRESGLLSAKREYLRLERGKFAFDICAAPFGTSYFFSWWLSKQPPRFVLLYGCLTFVAVPLLFLICATVFGFANGFFVFLCVVVGSILVLRNTIDAGASDLEDLILAIPTVGPIYRALFRPATYYATDTRLMFQESVHRAVVEAIGALRLARGLRALSPEENRPTVRDLLR